MKQTCNDVAHEVANCFKDIFFMLGASNHTDEVTKSTRRMTKNIWSQRIMDFEHTVLGRFLDYDMNNKPPYIICQKKRNEIDNLVKNMKIPTSSTSYLRAPFGDIIHLKTHDILMYIGPIGVYLIQCMGLPVEYEEFFVEFIRCLEFLTLRVILKSDYARYHKRICKVVARAEILLPYSSMTITRHILLHYFEKNGVYTRFGGWVGCNMLYGERFHPLLHRFSVAQSRNFYKTIAKSIVNMEKNVNYDNMNFEFLNRQNRGRSSMVNLGNASNMPVNYHHSDLVITPSLLRSKININDDELDLIRGIWKEKITGFGDLVGRYNRDIKRKRVPRGTTMKQWSCKQQLNDNQRNLCDNDNEIIKLDHCIFNNIKFKVYNEKMKSDNSILSMKYIELGSREVKYSFAQITKIFIHSLGSEEKSVFVSLKWFKFIKYNKYELPVVEDDNLEDDHSYPILMLRDFMPQNVIKVKCDPCDPMYDSSVTRYFMLIRENQTNHS